MKNIYNSLGVIIITVSIATETLGQTTIGAEFRPRTEIRQGFRKPLADTLDASVVTLQRTRVNFSYTSANLNAAIVLQDARIWGDGDTKSSTSKVEINEAWFEYCYSKGFSSKIGRQALNYDDKRLFSSPPWSNTGTSHDALVLKYTSRFFRADAGFAYNNSGDYLMNSGYEYPPKQNYKSLNYIWLSKSFSKCINVSLIGVKDGFEVPNSNFDVDARYTFGGNLFYANDSSKWAITVTTYKQKGIDPNKFDGLKFANLDASFFAAKVVYKLHKLITPCVGVDYYSGSNTNIDAGTSNTFNRLYGAPHLFNGFMEYFQTLPKQGLIDYYGAISSRLTSKFSTEIAAHLFYFDKDFYYKTEKLNSNIGSEIDLTLKYSLSKEMQIQAGFSQFINSSSTKKYFNMDGVKTQPQQWTYLMMTVTI